MTIPSNAIRTSPDDLLVRPWFNPDGTFAGYFALPTTEFANGTIQPGAGELRQTPLEAVEAYLKDRWPEFGAEAVGRRWIVSRSGGYKPESDFEELQDAIHTAFPDLHRDKCFEIATKCEMEHSRQQRQNRNQ